MMVMSTNTLLYGNAPTCSYISNEYHWINGIPVPISYDYCNVGYYPSTQLDFTDKQTTFYKTQSGSSCPCACYPDNVKYPQAYKKQHNCKDEGDGVNTDGCLDTVRYVSSDDTSCVTYMCICTCMCSHV